MWSWRPKAGVKSVKRLTGDGGNKVWSPGRSRISRKTIAQGRPVVRLVPVVLPRAFFLHADHGCERHPAFPAPSVFDEGDLIAKLGRSAPRERGRASSFFAWSILLQAMRRIVRRRRCAAPQDEVEICGTQSDPHGEEARKRRLEPCRPVALPVVPAHAGTHNHRSSLLERAGAAAVAENTIPWLWVPACARTDETERALAVGPLADSMVASYIIGEKRAAATTATPHLTPRGESSACN